MLEIREAHVPVKTTSFIGDLSKDSILALGLDFTFSTDCGGLAGDVVHFLASVFLFP